MDNIGENINELRSQIPSHVKIVAVSKTKSVAEIRAAMSAGQIIFGESKALELSGKHGQISGAEWHFIGHLQTNKVKYIAPFVRMIQSVDSLRLFEEIDRQAKNSNRVIDCLLQIHIAREETKFGLSGQEAVELLKTMDFKHVRICGLMGIATFTDNTDAIRDEFRGLAGLFQRIRREFFSADPSFCELSMGMSDDYRIAIEEGATIVRIGSSIFGKR